MQHSNCTASNNSCRNNSSNQLLDCKFSCCLCSLFYALCNNRGCGVGSGGSSGSRSCTCFVGKQPQQQGDNTSTTELDPVLLLVILHGFLQGFSAVIQTAFDRSLRNALNFRNFLDRYFIKISQHNRRTLLHRKRYKHSVDGLLQICLIQGFVRNKLCAVFLYSVKNT